MSENNFLPKCMDTCLFWEQVFYKDDFDMEDEQCYDYCKKKHHGIKEKDCKNCLEYECAYTQEEIERMQRQNNDRTL